jgi:hypothetical protein
MKKIYTLTLLTAILLISGCSKDFLKSYDRRILGTWKIIDVDRYGFTAADALPFAVTDLFTFKEDGELVYEQGGKTYRGSWDIVRKSDDDEDQKALQITAIDFTNQQVRTEYFNNMQFTSTNRFTAFINYNTRTYVYRFLRQ